MDHWLKIERTKGKEKGGKCVVCVLGGGGRHLFNQLSELQQLMNSRSSGTPGHSVEEPDLLPPCLPPPSLSAQFLYFTAPQCSGRGKQPSGMPDLSGSWVPADWRSMGLTPDSQPSTHRSPGKGSPKAITPAMPGPWTLLSSEDIVKED